MVTTFVCSAGCSTHSGWRFLEKCSRADIRLEELEYPSLKKIMSICSCRVQIYVHSCVYRAIKLWFLLDFPEMAELPLNSAEAL